MLYIDVPKPPRIVIERKAKDYTDGKEALENIASIVASAFSDTSQIKFIIKF